MAISYRVTKIAEGQSDEISLFGQLVFSGVYTPQSGDSITFDFTTPPFVPNPNVLNFNPFPVYRKTSTLKASRPPIDWAADLQGLYIPVILIGKLAQDLKMIIFDSVAQTELAAGAYPGQLTSNPFNTMQLSYRKNL